MDRNLELRLIEDGFNPRNPEEVSLGQIEAILGKMYSAREQNPAGGVVFDGISEIIARYGELTIVLRQQAMVITCEKGYHEGLLFYNPLDDIVQRSYIHIQGKRRDLSHIVIFGDEGGDFEWSTRGPKTDAIRIQLSYLGGTKILYLPHIEEAYADRLFWKIIGEMNGLNLRETSPPNNSLPPGYAAKDEKTGIAFFLGTFSGAHLVTANFPRRQKTEKLYELVRGLDVNIQNVGDMPVGNGRGVGTKFEVYVHIHKGPVVAAYINRLLEQTSQALCK